MNINEKLKKIKYAEVITDEYEQVHIMLLDENKIFIKFIPYNINNREKILNTLKENNRNYKKQQQNNFLDLSISIMIIIINILFFNIQITDIIFKIATTILNSSVLLIFVIRCINIINDILKEKEIRKAINNNYLPNETKELKEKLYNSSREINQALKEKITKSLTNNQKNIDNLKQKEIININELYNLINQDKEESLLTDNLNNAVILKLKRK